MKHLEEPETLDPIFLNLGKIHARHEEQLGFRRYQNEISSEIFLSSSPLANQNHCSEFTSTTKRRGVVGKEEANATKKVMNALMNNSDLRSLRDTKHGVPQASEELHRKVHSFFVPEYFLKKMPQFDANEGDLG
ncbi:hypothetical protein NECAME_06184 [Necator americanus]|uniref:Uncharacterized protein n=1 Tax=Necator americanus TaxID=51031 RepID=W2TUU3_NECAM|nr:hypothetical protein NECAME_06184 [Necator americanus]ETN85870.1 hypothetical protein NECAME_06184 [Necator americanus]